MCGGVDKYDNGDNSSDSSGNSKSHVDGNNKKSNGVNIRKENSEEFCCINTTYLVPDDTFVTIFVMTQDCLSSLWKSLLSYHDTKYIITIQNCNTQSQFDVPPDGTVFA